MGKVSIDGSEITAAEFSDWILGELGWPNLRIPKGLHPTAATEQVPPVLPQHLAPLLPKRGLLDELREQGT
jgi:hypothetical protein